MNKEQFIKAIRVAVCDSIPDDIGIQLQHPITKKNNELKELAEWYSNLNDYEKQMVKKISKLSVDNSVFGFLCVLDGVRAIEGTQEKGILELAYLKDGSKILLNEDKGMYLHDIYNKG